MLVISYIVTDSLVNVTIVFLESIKTFVLFFLCDSNSYGC